MFFQFYLLSKAKQMIQNKLGTMREKWRKREFLNVFKSLLFGIVYTCMLRERETCENKMDVY